MHNLPALLLLVAGILGVAPVDGRLAWLAVLLAGPPDLARHPFAETTGRTV